MRTAAHEGETLAAAAAQRADFLRLLLGTAILAPVVLAKTAKEYCSILSDTSVSTTDIAHNTPVLRSYPCNGTSTDHVYFVARNYLQLWTEMLLFRWPSARGWDCWSVIHVWLQMAVVVAAAVATPTFYKRFVLPTHAAVMSCAWSGVIHLAWAYAGWEPSGITWDHLRQFPVYRVLSCTVHPTTPLLDGIATAAVCVLSLVTCLVVHRHHPHLELDVRKQLLYILAGAAATAAAHTWPLIGRRHRVSMAVAPDAANACVPGPLHANKVLQPPEPLAAVAAAACAGAHAGEPSPSKDVPAAAPSGVASVPGQTLSRAAADLRKRLRKPLEYTPFLELATVRLKLEGVSLSDLTPGWQERLTAKATEQMGGLPQAVYMREGCIEVVIDFALANGGQPGAASATQPLDMQALIAALQLRRAPTSFSTTVMGFAGSGPLLAACSHTLPPPRIMQLAPRVLALPCGSAEERGSGSGDSAALGATEGDTSGAQAPTFQVVVAIPEAALDSTDGMLAVPHGLELTARARDSYLHAGSTLHHSGAGSSSSKEDAGSADGRWAEYNMQLLGLPPGPGLLLVDCRCEGAVSSMVPVLLVDDVAVAQELQQAAACYSPERLDQLLADLGLWLEYVRSPMSQACVQDQAGVPGVGKGQPRSSGPMTAPNGRRSRGPADGDVKARLGAHLLQHACARGWVHTARWLLADLMALGLRYRDLAPGRLLTCGSPTLLQAAVGSGSPSMVVQVLTWSIGWRRSRSAPARAAAQRQGRGNIAHAVALARLALMQALGLSHAGPGVEEKYLLLGHRFRMAHAAVMPVLDTLYMTLMLWRTISHGAHLLDPSHACMLAPCALDAVLALAALTMRDRANFHRLVLASLPVRYCAYMTAQVCRLAWPLPSELLASHLRTRVNLCSAILNNMTSLVSVQCALVFALLRLPLQAAQFLQVCRLTGLLAETCNTWGAAGHAIAQACISVVTTVVCHTGLRLRALALQSHIKHAHDE